MRDYFPQRSKDFPLYRLFLWSGIDLSLGTLYTMCIQRFTVSSQIQRIDAYTLVNMRMTIYDKIRGRTANPPRRPASADLTFDSLQMEGVGYNDPSKLWLNGQNPKDPNRWYSRNGIPLKSYKDFEPGPKAYRDAHAPKCSVCGNECTNWNTRETGQWWCHYCSSKVRAVYSPVAMLPLDAGEHLEPSLTDKAGMQTCAKCLTSMLPRSDNMGFDCPKCHANYRNPAPVRPGPII
jgi:hypothetical protein